MKTNGPTVTVKMSCLNCTHEHSESYRVQGDSGHDVYCNHGDAKRRIGDTTWDTPAWCPLKPPDMSDSCTPRPPQPEWFGTGPGQWDSWWVDMHDPDVDPFVARASDGYCIRSLAKIVARDAVMECVPVAREGFPAPVGWGVVDK